MTATPGSFVWRELMTSDMKGAEAFYKNVVGWTCADSGMAEMSYSICHAGDAMIAGMMNIPDEAKKMGVPPNWSGYISVEDVDAATAKLKSLGGSVHRPPSDIPGVGRFSVVADPQGAIFDLFKSANPAQADPPPDTPGHVGWNELYAQDWEKSFAFYNAMFGWTKGEAIDMGPMGKYQLFSHGGKDIGGMMNKPPHMPNAAWGFYFNVDGAAAAAARVTAAGGKILHGPVPVPGGHTIVQGLDPQGAFFGLVSPKA